MRTHPAALTLLLLLTPVWAEDDYPILVYPVPWVDQAPALDGKLNDPAWTAAPVAGGFTWYNRQELVPVQTTVRWVADEEALYLGVWADEPNLDALVPQVLPRDAKQIFSTEAIEVFIDPRHDHADYYQLAVNAAGSLYDSQRTEPAWNSSAEAAAAKGEGGWGMELKIPWATFDLEPRRGMVVGANVMRDRTLKAREWSNWAQTKADFHDPIRSAHLVIDPPEGALENLRAEFRKGDRQGPLTFLGAEGIGDRTYVAMAETMLADLTRRAAGLRAVAEAEGEGVRTALAPTLAQLDTRLAEAKDQIAGGLDGGSFTKLEMSLATLGRGIDAALWDARLEALLAGL